LILYLDTSSMLKLYVEEADSDAVEKLVNQANGAGTSLVGYAEMRAGLARAQRMGRLTTSAYDEALASFEARWATIYTIAVDAGLVRAAGDLAERHPLRGFDAVHLASAIALRADTAEPVTFSSADGRLLTAARAEGLPVP